MEFYSSNFYLQMSAWCENHSLTGCAKFLQDHATEEMSHMMRIFQYVNDKDAMAVLGRIEAPPTEYESVKQVFELIMEHEVLITTRISELVHIASQENDYTTLNFLQWFVAEQHEEELLFKSILDRINIIGLEGQGLFFIDREIGETLERINSAPE